MDVRANMSYQETPFLNSLIIEQQVWRIKVKAGDVWIISDVVVHAGKLWRTNPKSTRPSNPIFYLSWIPFHTPAFPPVGPCSCLSFGRLWSAFWPAPFSTCSIRGTRTLAAWTMTGCEQTYNKLSSVQRQNLENVQGKLLQHSLVHTSQCCGWTFCCY